MTLVEPCCLFDSWKFPLAMFDDGLHVSFAVWQCQSSLVIHPSVNIGIAIKTTHGENIRHTVDRIGAILEP